MNIGLQTASIDGFPDEEKNRNQGVRAFSLPRFQFVVTFESPIKQVKTQLGELKAF